jgi:hypothetical protein
LEELALLVLALFSGVEAGDGTMVTHDAGPNFTGLAFGIVENDGGLGGGGGFGRNHDFDFFGWMEGKGTLNSNWWLLCVFVG